MELEAMPAHGNGYLVETAWLAANLDNPNLRILDCTVEMHRGPNGGWQPMSGRAAYDTAQISNTLFVDLLVDLKDRDSDLNHMLPPPRQFADAMGTLGIDNDTRGVVGLGIGLVVGVLLSLVLIYVINVQSFGWTIQFHVPVAFLARASFLILAATTLAGLYPARLAGRFQIVDLSAEG